MGPPIGIPIAQHGKTHHLLIIQRVRGHVVPEHPLGKRLFVSALDLDVDQQPVLATVAKPDLEQLVGEAFAYFGPADDLLKFLVEAFVAPAPIDVGGNVREEKDQELLEIPLEGFLPG
jgi:hypothetical protein